MRTTILNRVALLTGALLALSMAQANAQFSGVGQPYPAYIANTSLIPIAAPDFTTVSSLTDGILTVSLSPSMEVGTVPAGGWATWGSPPDTEGDSPRVIHAIGYDPSVTQLIMSFDKPVDIFGFEAEPDPFSVHTLTADFYDGMNLVGSISRDVNGFAGARLFAGVINGGQFTKVILSSDVDFAVARLRYSLAEGGDPNVPEPGSMALLGGMVLSAGIVARRRRQR